MMVSVLFFIIISVIVVLGLTGPSSREYKIASDSILAKQDYYLAESGAEDTYYRLKNHNHVNQIETLLLGSSSATTYMNFLGNGNVDINTTGNTSNFERAVDLKISGQSTQVLDAPVETGYGGLDYLVNNASISGDVYANGSITGSGDGSTINITGSAMSSSAALTEDEFNGSGTPSYNIDFASSTSAKDISQSFQVLHSIPLSKISLYLKKVGSPSDATVTIYRDGGGYPDSSAVVASTTISASTVATTYSWIDAVFSQKQMLSIGQTYWFVIDTSVSSSNYYVIGASAGGYSSGTGYRGVLGSSWTSPVSSSTDFYFQTYLGGFTGLIQGGSGTSQITVGAPFSGISVSANSVGGIYSGGTTYCTNDLGNNSPSCISGSEPSVISLPISDTDISAWKAIAASGTVLTSDQTIYSSGGSTTAPTKILGNLSINGPLTIGGTLWVTGNLTMSTGSAKINLGSGYGSNSGVIIVDGKVTVNGYSSTVIGDSSTSGYVLIISTNNSISTSSPAIYVNNKSHTDHSMFYAPYGLIYLSGTNTKTNYASGYQVDLNNSGGSVSYSSSFASLVLQTGGSSSSGYSVSSWTETQ